MFTGIITGVGQVRAVDRNGDTRITVETAEDTAAIALGASITCSGPCLTVIDKGPGWFMVAASSETMARTTLGSWGLGTAVNLERALRLGDELGGHIVSGHIDGVAEVVDTRPDGDSVLLSIAVPEPLARYIAPKGSVALDGVSLTVNEVDGVRFGVNIIAHTAQATTFGATGPGDRLNLEVDMLARYVARLIDKG